MDKENQIDLDLPDWEKAKKVLPLPYQWVIVCGGMVSVADYGTFFKDDQDWGSLPVIGFHDGKRWVIQHLLEGNPGFWRYLPEAPED